MKTALEQLIENLQEKREIVESLKTDLTALEAIDSCIAEARGLLEIEKEQLNDAWQRGFSNGFD